MDIWNVSNINRQTDASLELEKEIRLWRMDSKNFRVIEQGYYLSILSNPSYTLLHKKYTSVFQPLIEQIELIPVTLHDFVLDSENTDYIELRVINTINTETIKTTDSSGLKTWTHNGYLFVSGRLKEQLKNLSDGELEFHLGFSMFGGDIL